MTLRAKIQANSSHKPEKAKGAHLHLNPHVDPQQQFTRTNQLHKRNQLRDHHSSAATSNALMKSLGHSESSPDDIARQESVPTNNGKKPTWADDCDSACAIGTKATCAALR